MRHWLRTLGPLVGLLCAATSDARIWYVKADGTGDTPTIQAAIDSAQPGDEVVLAPGLYNWSTQGDDGDDPASMILTKPGLTLRSESGPEATILDAERRVGVIRCRGAGEVRIEGLTITGGVGHGGSGIWAEDADLIISNCIIRNNSGNIGAGVLCVKATIVGCQILDNRGSTFFPGVGTGISCGAGTVISHCIIRGNSCGGDPGCDGSGIYASGATITDCWIEDNYAGGVFGAFGGGIYAFGGTIARCTFVANTARAVALTEGTGAGGAIYCGGGRLTVSECVFVRNSATGGAAIASDPRATEVSVTGCTLVGNHGASLDGGAGVGGISLGSPGTVRSTIIAWNEGYASSGAGRFSCTDVYGNTLGDTIHGIDEGGNFSLDPEFCSVDPVGSLNLLLQRDSPCAAENLPGSCGLVGAAPVGCGTVTVREKTWSEVKVLFRR